MGVENFLTFMATALFFIMTPGIDTIFILNKSIGQGRKAGMYATLGINSGVLVHTAFAALGLSLLVAKSALAFSVIKYLGAAYLVYLGVAKLMVAGNEGKAPAPAEVTGTGRQHYISGLVTNTLNPKVALFFLAFFPQFIRPEAINRPLPFLILGVTYAAMGMVWFLILTLFAAAFSEKLKHNPHVSKWINKISGAVFLMMGLKIALAKR